jgi:hypothetical protein
MQTFDETMKADIAAKPAAMQTQKQLLAIRYVLEPKLDPKSTMSRGKPLPVGPTARLKEGMNWDDLAAMELSEVRKANAKCDRNASAADERDAAPIVFFATRDAVFPLVSRFVAQNQQASWLKQKRMSQIIARMGKLHHTWR